MAGAETQGYYVRAVAADGSAREGLAGVRIEPGTSKEEALTAMMLLGAMPEVLRHFGYTDDMGEAVLEAKFPWPERK